MEGVATWSTQLERVTFEGGRPSGPLPITQIAFVVRDIDQALENFNRTLGWGPWNIYEHKPPALHDTYLRGEPTPLHDDRGRSPCRPR